MRGSHHAHALHSPYWWLKCAVGVDNAESPLVRAQVPRPPRLADHRPGPRGSSRIERTLNPVLGKSLVVYTEKAADARAPLPEVPGVIDARRRSPRRSTPSRRIQEPDGNIPWTPGNHTDPWNLVEAAMALDVGGHHAEAERAYEWLRIDAARRRRVARVHRRSRGQGPHARHQRHRLHRQRRVAPLPLHRRHRLPRRLLDRRRAGHRLRARRTSASRARSRGAATTPATARCSPDRRACYASLRCAIAIAERLGHERPDWELSLGSLADRGRPPAPRVPRQGPLGDGLVLPDPRWCAPRPAARRCASPPAGSASSSRAAACAASSDRPWVTAAETCEFVMALDAIGADEHARQLFTWVQFLRAEGGGYWTGANFDDEAFHRDGELYPVEQPTWNSAAVVLAANALGGDGPTAGLFRGEGLPVGLTLGRAHRGRRGDRGRARRERRWLRRRRSTRRLPVVDTGAKPARRPAACHTRNGACPPSAGSSNTSWNTSMPAGGHERRPQPRSRRAPTSNACPPSMKQSPSGVPQCRATVGESAITATTTSSSPASSMVRRKHGRVSMRPVRGSTRRVVVVLPPRLVLLGAPVVVDGEADGAPFAGRSAEVDRRLAAVGADLEQRARRRRRRGRRRGAPGPRRRA